MAIKEITDRISSSDIEFDMITLRFDKNLPKVEKIGNVTVYRIGFSKADVTPQQLVKFPMYFTKVLYPVLAFWKAASLDRKNKYDALWSMMSYMGFPALFFNFFHRKVPMIVTLQEGDSIEHVTKRLRIRMVSFLYRAIFKKAALVQVISQYLSDFARDVGYEGKIEVVPNGVDLSRFSKKPSDTELFALKSKLDKKYTDTFLITTSRLVPKNAVGDIIEALTFLPPEIKLLVIGNGPEEQALREKTNSLGLESRVLFLGFISHDDLPPYLYASDIFIRPSLSEGFGISFVEAMAADLPVIATPVGGITDFLIDKRTGLFCNVQDPKSIAGAVEKILANLDFRNTLVLNAKRMVTERYSWDLIAKEMKMRVFHIVEK